MDTSQWPQQENIGLIVKPMEEMVSMNACSTNLDQRKTSAIRPPKEQALNCPRCNSTNTKFCYYNNYSLTQPRYFCKTCRRYWTEGGSLRNVPVGGGSRKNRRSSSSSSSSTSSSSKILTHQNPKIHETQDLNLAFHTMSEFVHDHHHLPNIANTNFSTTVTTTTASATSLSEMLRNGINNSSSRGSNTLMMNGAAGSNNFMPTNADNYSTGFTLQDFKPSGSTLNFGIDHGLGSVGSVYGGGVHQHQQHQQQHQENGNGIMRPLFPFEDLRQVSTSTNIPTTATTTNEQNHGQDHQFHEQNRTGQGDSNGYWSGMLGGGSW